VPDFSFTPRFSEVVTPALLLTAVFNGFEMKLLKQLVRFGSRENISLKRGVNETDLVDDRCLATQLLNTARTATMLESDKLKHPRLQFHTRVVYQQTS
jgi:hypothetical protein